MPPRPPPGGGRGRGGPPGAGRGGPPPAPPSGGRGGAAGRGGRGGGPAGAGGAAGGYTGGAGSTAGPKLADHVQTIGVRKPGYGAEGRVFQVYTNHFKADITDGIIAHYDGPFSFALPNPRPLSPLSQPFIFYFGLAWIVNGFTNL